MSPGVSEQSFFLSVLLSSGRLSFALFSIKLKAAFQPSFLSKYFVRVALLFGPLASHLAASTAVSLE
jgi:hypothetical protein